MEIASWMSSSHQRASCIGMEDGSSPAAPGDLQQFSATSCFGGVHWALLPWLLLWPNTAEAAIAKWHCGCQLSSCPAEAGKSDLSHIFMILTDSMASIVLLCILLVCFSLTFLTSGTEKVKMILESLSWAACYHTTSWPKIHTQRSLRKEKPTKLYWNSSLCVSLNTMLQVNHMLTNSIVLYQVSGIGPYNRNSWEVKMAWGNNRASLLQVLVQFLMWPWEVHKPGQNGLQSVAPSINIKFYFIAH